jgi:hypothetical protein
MPTITLTPDSFKEISELKIANNGNFSKKTLTNNDEGLSETDEILPLAGGNVIQTKDGKDTVVGKVEVDPNNKDQFVFKANDPKLTGEVKFDYGVKQASGSMPPTKATVEIEIVSEEEAAKRKKEAQIIADEKKAEATGLANTTFNSPEEANTLINTVFNTTFNSQDQNSYSSKIKTNASQVTNNPSTVDSEVTKLNETKSKIPHEWKSYANSLNRISSGGDPKDALAQYQFAFLAIESIQKPSTDKQKAKAQAVMLHALLKSASNLDPKAKFIILSQALIFSKYHKLMPAELDNPVDGMGLDTLMSNSKVNFGYINPISTAGAITGTVSLAGSLAGLTGKWQGFTALNDKLVPSWRSAEAIKSTAAAATEATKAARIASLSGLSDEMSQTTAALKQAEAALKAATGNDVQTARESFNKAKEAAELAKKAFDKEYGNSLLNATGDLIGGTAKAAKNPNVQNSGNLIGKGGSAFVSGFMGEKSLVKLYEIQDESLLSWGTGGDLLAAVGTGAGVGTLFGGPVGTLIGGGIGLLKFGFDSWQKGKIFNPRDKFLDQYDNTVMKLAEFAGSDYSALTDYTPSSSYVASSPPPQTQQAQKEDQTKIASGNPSPFACA